MAVIDNCNEIIGRGEIISMGNKFNKKNATKFIQNHMNELQNHMNEFMEKHRKGNERIKSLMYKMEIIKTKINSTNILS